VIGHSAGPLRILHLEDSDLDAELIEAELESLGHPIAIERVMTRDAFARAAVAGRYDLILADYVLPTFDGVSALGIARTQCPDTPFIFCSGTLGEDVAVEALKNGATDYVVKQRLDRMPRTIVRALAEARSPCRRSTRPWRRASPSGPGNSRRRTMPSRPRSSSGSGRRMRCGSPSAWTRSGSSRAASRTISTTCSR
jgi:CheY-like chemotaxis protein